MAIKKSAYSQPYFIVEEENGSIKVYNFFENVKESLRKIAEIKSFAYDSSWTTRQFGSKICKEFGDGKVANINNYVVLVKDSGEIVTFMEYDNTKGALREVSEKIGFTFDSNWTTRQFGHKLIETLNK